MKELFGGLIVTIVVVLLICVMGFAIQGTDFLLFKYFAPKYESVRRETFEKSKAYNQGVIQEIQSMQFQYEQADPNHKAALATIILRRTADYDLNLMPVDTRNFIEKLKGH